ncbi:MAG TPA: hypothetical protein VG370_01105 [Chloroflexota bacterium]|jgi:hypothetical protein|nr:hypothetical protein [Chloroflexota bacterium]
MGVGRLGAVVLVLALVAGCTEPADAPSAAARRPAADGATAGAARPVVVGSGRWGADAPSTATPGPAATPSARPIEWPTALAASPPGQSAAARTLAQAPPESGQRVTRGTLALPDPTQPARPTVAAPAAGPADAAATPSPSPSPVPTLRPAHPPARYPRLTAHGGPVIVRDRPQEAAGFYRSDSLTPVPPGLLSGPPDELGGETPADGEAVAAP